MESTESLEETTSNIRSVKLPRTVNWGTATVIGVFTGMLYGGSKEATSFVSKDAEVMLKLGSTADKREQYRLMRDAMEKRFVSVTKGSLVGGVRLGMFTASFYGLQNFLMEKRGVNEVYNTVVAGSSTPAAFGLILPGSLSWRLRNVAMGSVLCTSVCFPLGWLHLKLVEKANEGRINVQDVEDSDDEDAEKVDNDEGDLGLPESTGRLKSKEGEIDGQEIC